MSALMGCWEYDGQLSHNGYGRHDSWANRQLGLPRTVATHRAAYEVIVGLIPDGLDLDHLCRNRACYNPWHLEPVTRKENIQRAVPFGTFGKRGRQTTQCPRGHEYSEQNTLVNNRGSRVCRECNRLRCAARRDTA
jgi:hypothetical protein